MDLRRNVLIIGVWLAAVAIPLAASGQTTTAAAASSEHKLLKRGALAGAFVMGALPVMDLAACDKGCEDGGGTGILMLLGAGVGTAVGGVLGHLADRYAAADRARSPAAGTPNRFFPSRPSGRIGVSASQVRPGLALVAGTQKGQEYSVVWQVSPYVSAHVEYARFTGRFDAREGAVPQAVLDNLIPASSRIAGATKGVESRRLRSSFTELIGVHPRPFGRVRVEFLAGLSSQARESRDYYEQRQQVVGAPSVGTGKYYVLDFQTPDDVIVFGVEGEVAIVPGISVVPALRFTRGGSLGGTRTVAVGANWRF